MVLVKPQSQPVLRPSTGGLRADFDKKKIARHAGAFYYFGKTNMYFFRKQAQ